MLTQALFTVLLSLSVRAITLEDCPGTLNRDDYMRVHGDKCYYFYLKQSQHYQTAEDTCHLNGGTLAIIQSKDVQIFLNEELSYTYDFKKRVWIGLNDLGEEGTFRWVDGSRMTYDNFASGEGTKASIFLFITRELEDCVAMDPITGQWHDYKCESVRFIDDEHKPFIYEFPPEKHTPTPTAATAVTTLGQNATEAVSNFTINYINSTTLAQN